MAKWYNILRTSGGKRYISSLSTAQKNRPLVLKKQYIATVNQNQLAEIKSYLDPKLFDKIVTKNTDLTLTDDHESEKLLGITVYINDN